MIYRARLPRYQIFSNVLGEHLKTITNPMPRADPDAEVPHEVAAANDAIIQSIRDMYLISMKGSAQAKH